MRFEIVTLFPELFAGIFEHGVLRRARANGLVEIDLHDLRSFAYDRHRTVDDRPFGGGEGMVLKPEPIAAALASLGVGPLGPQERARRGAERMQVVLLSAQGRPFAQAMARELAEQRRVVLLCGRYEGVDERVNELFCDRELSIGDYVLSGGELAAAVVVDATMRLLPGVLGNAASSHFESFGPGHDPTGSGRDGATDQPKVVPTSTHDAGGLLDYPHYTRPPEFHGLPVPQVLSSGDHAAIRRWRRERALEKTWRNRPDLLEHAALSTADRVFVQSLRARED